jgi:hypothetical protein
MYEVIQTLIRAGPVALVSSLVAACASSEHTTSSSAARTAQPWAQNLNEPPPSREPASSTAAAVQGDLNAARVRSSR